MSFTLHEDVWEDSEKTLSQECIPEGNHKYCTEITVDSHGEDHNPRTENKPFLFDLNETYHDEMETSVSDNFCTANKIDQEMRDLPPIQGCPNELIMSQESNSGLDESLLFSSQLSDLETKISAVSLGRKVCVVKLGEYEEFGDSNTVSCGDPEGKSSMLSDPRPHNELVSEQPNDLKRSPIRYSPMIFIDLSSDVAQSSSNCEVAALSGVTQASESEEQDSHSPVPVSKPNPILPCTTKHFRQRRTPKNNFPYSYRPLAPRVAGPKGSRPSRPKTNQVLRGDRYVEPFPVSLYPFAAKHLMDVDYLSYLIRQHGENRQKVKVPLIPDVSGRSGGYLWIEPKPAQDIKPEERENWQLGPGRSSIPLRSRAEAVRYFTRSRKGKGKEKMVVVSE